MKSALEFFGAAGLGWVFGKGFPEASALLRGGAASFFISLPRGGFGLFTANLLSALLMLALGRVHSIGVSFLLAVNGALLGLFWARVFLIMPHMPIETAAILVCAECARNRRYGAFLGAAALFACAAWIEASASF